MSKVWIPNLTKNRDYSKAESFGELRHFTAGYQSLGNLERLNFVFIQQVHKTDAEDYLLLGGVLIFNVLSAIAWLVRHDKCKLLTWDSKIDEYRCITLTKHNILIVFDRLTINQVKEDAETTRDDNTSDTDS